MNNIKIIVSLLLLEGIGSIVVASSPAATKSIVTKPVLVKLQQLKAKRQQAAKQSDQKQIAVQKPETSFVKTSDKSTKDFIQEFVTAVYNIPQNIQAKDYQEKIAVARNAYEKVYNFSKNVNLSPPQRDVIKKSLDEFSAKARVNIKAKDEKLVDADTIKNFSDAVQKISIQDKMHNKTQYKKDVEQAIKEFMKLRSERQKASITTEQSNEIKKGATKLFGSMTRQEALEFNKTLHFE